MDVFRRARNIFVRENVCAILAAVITLILIITYIRIHGAPTVSHEPDLNKDREEMDGMDKVIVYPKPATKTTTDKPATSMILLKALRAKVNYVANNNNYDSITKKDKQQAQPDKDYKVLDLDQAEQQRSLEEAAYKNKQILQLLHQKMGPLFKSMVKPVENPEPLKGAMAYYKMPQLRDDPRSRCPVFQIASNKKNIEVVIGIPTVKRAHENYLMSTLSYLISRMEPRERQYTLIVVYVGEVDLNYVAEVATALYQWFPEELGKLIEVVSPSPYWYPDWNNYRVNLGDSKPQWIWRTKHNLDVLFLMTYCQSRADFFLIVEDDVVASYNYRKMIIKYVYELKTNKKEWLYINFSSNGGSGKLFSDKSLKEFTNYMQDMYTEKPFDWLLQNFISHQYCGQGSDKLICMLAKSEIPPTYHEDLFVHIGIPSIYYDEVPSDENIDPFDYTHDFY